MTKLFWQFFRFGLVGGIGFIVDAGILALFIYGLHCNAIKSRLVSFLIAVTVTWAFNRYFTFNANNSQKLKEWFRYFLANGIGGLLNLGLYSLLVIYGYGLFQKPLIALVIGSIAGMFFNFFMSKRYVFS
ncbi:MAG: GtrA family protein [Gammaproteobacteria bacterium]|nr:GtrA family protein [Gammaproteobacteria bacterium]